MSGDGSDTENTQCIVDTSNKTCGLDSYSVWDMVIQKMVKKN